MLENFVRNFSSGHSAASPAQSPEDREVLAISWEFGSHLRSLGALVPDAILDTGGALFLLTPEKVREAGAQVFLAKTRGFKDQTAETVST